MKRGKKYIEAAKSVSYTHLDVYKRQIMMLMEVEMQMINPGEDVIIVGAKNSL